MDCPLALVGYGKMGRVVERLAPEYGFQICARFLAPENPGPERLSAENLCGAEMAMEFTSPASAPANLLRLAELQIPTVCGTTGWYEHLPDVRGAYDARHTGLVWSANFSVGMNVFFEIVAKAASAFSAHPEYGAWGWEIHHATKKDAPSGTLLNLSKEMLRAGFTRPVNLSASRAGLHPGSHEIGFDSAMDTITLRHTTRSREGFARGALLAARWLRGKQGAHEFREILQDLREPASDEAAKSTETK